MDTAPLTRRHAAALRSASNPSSWPDQRAEAEAARIVEVLGDGALTFRAICGATRFPQHRVLHVLPQLLADGQVSLLDDEPSYPGIRFYRVAGANGRTRRLTPVDELDLGAHEVWSRSEPTDTLVYFIRRPDGCVKIGYSRHLRQRIGAIQLGAGPVEVLVTFPGGRELEARLHRRFAPHRRDGEWFAPKKSLAAFITAAQRRSGPPTPDGVVERAASLGYDQHRAPDLG